jgi:hypothetical protein
MEPDEIRAEIQRRKKLAMDLKLRETLWSLYYWHLRGYAEKLEKDSEIVYPEVRETLEIAETYIQFRIGETTYRLIYKEGPSVSESDWGSREDRYIFDTTITSATLALEVDGKRVFDFEIIKRVQYTRDCPLFNETMGEITSFIEGPWTVGVAELLQQIKSYERDVWNKRQAPRLQQQLEEDMKKFGL